MAISERERAARIRRDKEQGQALVEFAVVLPLLVMVMLFAIWFYELTHVKLKVQEAARFAAWETTAFPMHSYKAGVGSMFSLPSLPQLSLPGTVGGMVSGQINQQISQQVGQLVPFGGFGLSARAVAAVSVETMARYADMDSSTLLPKGSRMLSASWTAPLVYALDQVEEPIPGGSGVNLGFGILASVFDILSAMNYRHATNQVVTSLLAAGKEMGGARATRVFGSPEWGFNRRGYIDARVAVAVRNEWFGSGLRRMIMPNAGVVIHEHHGLLADDWGLQDGGGQVDAGSCAMTDPRKPGWAPKCALRAQIKRMYLANLRARQVFKNVWLLPFVTKMRTVLAATRTTAQGPTVDELSDPAVVSRSYTGPETGRVPILQDMPPVGLYNTVPATGDYGKTLRQRGRWFMGCREAMQLGCTDTLSQENPFGDYLVRE